MKPLEEYIASYQPLFTSLTFRPFWQSDNHVKWTYMERESMEMFIEDTFIDLYYAFDPHYGVDFEGYMSLKLRKKVHHYAKKLMKNRSYETPYPDDFIERQKPLSYEEDLSLEPYYYLLSKRQQEVVRLTYETQTSASEIADILGIPRQNVYTHLRMAKKKIADFLESENTE